jgi:transposase
MNFKSSHAQNQRIEKITKEEAVRLSDEIGPKKAAEQLGVSYYTLQEWRKRRTLHGDGAHIGSGRSYASANIMLIFQQYPDMDPI